MQIKRFEASDIQEALRQVKREFGPDAVILSIKELERESKFKPLIKKVIEVVAAADNGFDNGSVKRERKTYRSNYDADSIKKTLFEYFEYMLLEGVEESVALDIVKMLKSIMPNPNLEEEVRRCILRVLQGQDMQTKRLKLKKNSNQKIAFFGPTGAGKTSTLVKLATAVSFSGRYEVGVVNLDNERIGASAQLEAFSTISGIEILSVKGKKEFKEALKGMREKDLILIDTPGIGRKTAFLAEELKIVLEEARDLEGYLVFSATTKTRDMLSLMEVYAPLRINGLIITKMDEASSVGNVLSVAYMTRLPLCYFSMGQEVPGSLKAANLWELVTRIFGRGIKEVISSLPPEELAFRRNRFEILMEEEEDLFWEGEGESETKEKGSNSALSLRI
ncbi:MAG: hypothetical protein ACK4WB_04240 [Desulfatiglandales bacterium]